MKTKNNTTAGTMADDLAAVAELLREHPDLPTPYVTAFSSGRVEVNFYLHLSQHKLDHDDQRDIAAGIVRAIGGEWSKEPDDYDGTFRFEHTRPWGRVHISVHREAVCERVVVRTEEVTVPATEAQVIEAKPERVETREVVEWRCSSLLAPTPEPAEVSA